MKGMWNHDLSGRLSKHMPDNGTAVRTPQVPTARWGSAPAHNKEITERDASNLRRCEPCYRSHRFAALPCQKLDRDPRELVAIIALAKLTNHSIFTRGGVNDNLALL